MTVYDDGYQDITDEDVRNADVTFRQTFAAFGRESKAVRNALDRCARWRGYRAPMHKGESR